LDLKFSNSTDMVVDNEKQVKFRSKVKVNMPFIVITNKGL